MAEHDLEMEARIKVLEERMLALEERMRRLTESLLGTLDGKPGVLSSMQRALELSERTAANIAQLTVQIDNLKLDRAKILGGIAVVATLSGLFVKYLLH